MEVNQQTSRPFFIAAKSKLDGLAKVVILNMGTTIEETFLVTGDK
jgi:hypothetical protein